MKNNVGLFGGGRVGYRPESFDVTIVKSRIKPVLTDEDMKYFKDATPKTKKEKQNE